MPNSQEGAEASNAVVTTEDVASLDKASWPTWMVTQFNFFLEEEMPGDHKALWVPMLLNWVALERIFAFRGTVRTTHHIPMVCYLIPSLRILRTLPLIDREQ